MKNSLETCFKQLLFAFEAKFKLNLKVFHSYIRKLIPILVLLDSVSDKTFFYKHTVNYDINIVLSMII